MSEVITMQPKGNVDENEGVSAQNDQEMTEAEKKRRKEEKSCLYKWCGSLRPNDDPVDNVGDNCCCVTEVGNDGGGNTRDGEDYGCDCWGGGCDSGDGVCDNWDGGCDNGDYGYDNGDGGCDIGDTGGDCGGGGID